MSDDDKTILLLHMDQDADVILQVLKGFWIKNATIYVNGVKVQTLQDWSHVAISFDKDFELTVRDNESPPP